MKKNKNNIKTGLHLRNKHRNRYDFDKLIWSYPQLKRFVRENKYGDESIDFADSNAVLALNTALLKHYYDIDNWEIPKGYLCPPIPGRADYIHNIADLLNENTGAVNSRIKRVLDVGVGANCVYPIIGAKEYGWHFVGTDIDTKAIESAMKIVEKNDILKGKVRIVQQNNPANIFKGIINKGEYFDFTICNPPFHSSFEEANKANKRKLSNLSKSKTTKVKLNFGGKSNELWYNGGEKRFIGIMIEESRFFAKNCNWFTTLVSKKSNLAFVYEKLKHIKAKEVKTIEMGQGNKVSRIVAWRF